MTTAAPPSSTFHLNRVPIVGISGGVVDPIRSKEGLDGIGTYTEALFAHLAEAGVATKRVDQPHLRSYARAIARTTDLHFTLPLPIAISIGAVAHTKTPGVSDVERAIDLYHSTDYMVPRLRRIPVVATVYDAIPLARPEWTNPRLRGLKNWLLRQSVRNADRVIAISEAAREEVIAHYAVAPERTRVIPLGVDASWCGSLNAQTTAQVLKKRKLERGYFLFVGTLQPRKNIGMLLDAYERLPPKGRADRQLVIVGKYGWNARDVRMRLERTQSLGRCVWLNHVPRDELRHLYAGAGAFVFPSLAEGFGLPVLEALASGLPTIGSDLPALREVGGTWVTYVRPNDASALAEGMAEIGSRGSGADDPAGRRAHAAQYTWPVCAARTVGVYRELWMT
jgi:alpha-1,3-rhamnosyl/mannosyltransferase